MSTTEVRRAAAAVRRKEEILSEIEKDDYLRELFDGILRAERSKGRSAEREALRESGSLIETPYSKEPLVISAAFSGSMLLGGGLVSFTPVSQDQAWEIACGSGAVESAVGHESTAEIFKAQLRLSDSFKAERRSVQLSPGQQMLVGQMGRRLGEGEVLSAEEMRQEPIQWLLVTRVR